MDFICVFEILLILQITQHFKHLTISDHHTVEITNDLLNFVIYFRLTDINILLVTIQLHCLFVDKKPTVILACKKFELILWIPYPI